VNCVSQSHSNLNFIQITAMYVMFFQHIFQSLLYVIILYFNFFFNRFIILLFLFGAIFATITNEMFFTKSIPLFKDKIYILIDYDFLFNDNICAEHPKLGQFLRAFSLKNNLKKLLSTQTSQELSCINGLRVISIVWVITGHLTAWIDWSLISN
jgi:hypothetical protein